MNTLNKLFAAGLLALSAAGSAHAAPFVMTNGLLDGQVTVGVDGYGAFGSSVGANSTNATYNPVGAVPPTAGTVFESGVAIRIGTAAGGARTFLTSGSIGSSGVGPGNPVVAGTPLSGVSGFTFGGLSFSLTQVLTSTFIGAVQTGSVLTQTYVMTNTGTSALSFEMLRYLDGDLLFNGSLLDGGGRLTGGGTEILFETDSATGSSTSTTFVGITGEGGTVPVTGRYEIDSYSGLRDRIIAGTALDDLITGDGADADQFIDAGPGYDVTLALRNLFTLGAGGTGTYVTRTIWGSGAPDTVIPEPGVLALVGLGLMGVAASRRRRPV